MVWEDWAEILRASPGRAMLNWGMEAVWAYVERRLCPCWAKPGPCWAILGLCWAHVGPSGPSWTYMAVSQNVLVLNRYSWISRSIPRSINRRVPIVQYPPFNTPFNTLVQLVYLPFSFVLVVISRWQRTWWLVRLPVFWGSSFNTPFNTRSIPHYGLSSSVAQLCLQSRWDVCLGNALRSILPVIPPFNTSRSIPPFNTLLNRRLPHIHRGPGVLTHSQISWDPRYQVNNLGPLWNPVSIFAAL